MAQQVTGKKPSKPSKPGSVQYLILLIGAVLLVAAGFVLVSGSANSPASAGAVSLSMQPALSTAGVGQTFDVTVQLDTGTQQVDSAEAYLDFDPAQLEVVSLAGGTALSTTLLSQFDNTKGQATFAAGTLEGPAKGRLELAVVKFRAKAAGQTVIRFSSGPATSGAMYQSRPLVGKTSDGSVTIR